MGVSENILITTLKKMGRLHEKIIYNVLIIVMILVCHLIVTSW